MNTIDSTSDKRGSAKGIQQRGKTSEKYIKEKKIAFHETKIMPSDNCHESRSGKQKTYKT